MNKTLKVGGLSSQDFVLEPQEFQEHEKLIPSAREKKKKQQKYFEKPKTLEQLLQEVVSLLKWIFFVLVAILGLMIATLVVLTGVTISTTNSEQFKRAVGIIDRVDGLYGYTKTMTDVTTGSKTQIEKAIVDYDVDGIITSVKNLVQSTKEVIKPESVQLAIDLGKQSLDLIKNVNLDQAKTVLSKVGSILGVIEPAQISSILDGGKILFEKGSEALSDAKQNNLIPHISQAAAGLTEVEARLKRINEFTFKLPPDDSQYPNHPAISKQ